MAANLKAVSLKNTLKWQFYGGVHGSFRVFPTAPLGHGACGAYDPRLRAW